VYENDAQPVLRRMLKQGRKEGRKVSPVSVSLVPEVLPIIDFMSCYAHSRPVMVTKVLHWLQNTDPECA